jgi:hypothetical protein
MLRGKTKIRRSLKTATVKKQISKSGGLLQLSRKPKRGKHWAGKIEDSLLKCLG